MRKIMETLKARLESGADVLLVSAVGGCGSVPRKLEAHMLVGCEGRLCGTVGGGAVEGHSIALAKQLLERRESCVREFRLDENGELNMVCGGAVSVSFVCLCAGDEAAMQMAQHALNCMERGEPCWLAIDLSRGKAALVDQNGQKTGVLPEALLGELNAVSRQVEIAGSTYYVEQLVRNGRVYIFGGGHVAQALVPVLSSCAFRCVVVEDREEFASRQLFPDAEEIRLIPSGEWGKTLRIGPEDCICIMTRGHQGDFECLMHALRTRAYYIGVIGSRRKIASTNERLREAGFGEQDIARIVTPIGLDIGAVTPAEIAVSIAAQMIQKRVQNKANPL